MLFITALLLFVCLATSAPLPHKTGSNDNNLVDSSDTESSPSSSLEAHDGIGISSGFPNSKASYGAGSDSFAWPTGTDSLNDASAARPTGVTGGDPEGFGGEDSEDDDYDIESLPAGQDKQPPSGAGGSSTGNASGDDASDVDNKANSDGPFSPGSAESDEQVGDRSSKNAASSLNDNTSSSAGDEEASPPGNSFGPGSGHGEVSPDCNKNDKSGSSTGSSPAEDSSGGAPGFGGGDSDDTSDETADETSDEGGISDEATDEDSGGSADEDDASDSNSTDEVYGSY